MNSRTINLHTGALPAPITSAFLPLALTERAIMTITITQTTAEPATLTLRAAAARDGVDAVDAPASARWALRSDATFQPAGVGASFTLPAVAGTHTVAVDVDPLAVGVDRPFLALHVVPGDPGDTMTADATLHSRLAA